MDTSSENDGHEQVKAEIINRSGFIKAFLNLGKVNFDEWKLEIDRLGEGVSQEIDKKFSGLDWFSVGPAVLLNFALNFETFNRLKLSDSEVQDWIEWLYLLGYELESSDEINTLMPDIMTKLEGQQLTNPDLKNDQAEKFILSILQSAVKVKKSRSSEESPQESGVIKQVRQLLDSLPED